MQNPAWFSAGTEIWAQECLSGLEYGQEPSLAQCRDVYVGAGVFVGLEQGRTQPVSVQRVRCGLRSVMPVALTRVGPSLSSSGVGDVGSGLLVGA